MKHSVTASIALLTTLVSAGTIVSQDGSSAARGKTLWGSRGCAACHAFGKKLAGPDLSGITRRRDRPWLLGFLKNSDSILTDSVGKALLRESKGVRMPKASFNEADAQALIAFFTAEDAAKK